MIGAAYFFGTGLRADTAKSVAASPIGSSLSNVRESSSVAASPLGSSLTAVRESRLDDYYGRFTNSSAAANSASLVALAKSRSDFYADLNNSATAADSYQNEWMGFTSPESVGARLSVASGLAADPSPWMKPEGINPSGTVDPAAKQVPWIKPEGIKAFGTK
jgi:hypothetical protein